ncbi:uncharacterized protein LOC129602095 isoform X1 [Paramacrobiotus metropolitanus]|uniref:uncharacterized protein LOC129602095 isoform X1 n=1 Tax=Paramacrobiotus metropolitanus TaxID=2943436 RepID=UPI00244565CF|nr:uncharacterized protein LOC129602095 isoform X1 [Paramacrobiotus metropolitanus]
MANTPTRTTSNINAYKSGKMRLAVRPPGKFESGSKEAFLKVMDEAYGYMKEKWTEERESERLAVRTLQKQVLERDRVISQQKSVMDTLREEKKRMMNEQQDASDSQRRIQELEARLAEEQRRVAELTARNTALLQVTESFHGAFAMYAKNREVVEKLMNSKTDTDNQVRKEDTAITADNTIPVPAAVAAEEHPGAVVKDAAESPPAPRDPASPPSEPKLPVEAVAENMEVDTELASVPPLPVADDTPSSVEQNVGADVAMPPALPTSPAPKSPRKPHFITLSFKPSLIHRSESVSPATQPKKRVSFSPLPEPVIRGKRKRAQSLLASSTCKACNVEYADEGELRRHSCPLQHNLPCRGIGCGKRFASVSGRRRHEKAAHGDQPKLESIH